jgi:hypothetical protein
MQATAAARQQRFSSCICASTCHLSYSAGATWRVMPAVALYHCCIENRLLAACTQLLSTTTAAAAAAAAAQVQQQHQS